MAEYPDCAANILHSRPDARAESDGCPESKLHDGSNSLDSHDGTASGDWHDGTASLDQHDGTATVDSKLQDGSTSQEKSIGQRTEQTPRLTEETVVDDASASEDDSDHERGFFDKDHVFDKDHG